MARSFFYFYFTFLFSFNLFADSQIFLNYCEKVINNDHSFSYVAVPIMSKAGNFNSKIDPTSGKITPVIFVCSKSKVEVL